MVCMGLFSRTVDPRSRLPQFAIDIADRGLETRNAAVADFVERAGFDDTSEWNVDLGTGHFVLKGSMGDLVCDDVQVIGTRNAAKDSWLWGWANESLPPERTVASGKVREFGEANGVDVLTEEGCPCKGDQMWAFCNIAIGLELGPYVYKAGAGDLELYLLLPGMQVVPH